ncbi:hypothetical protein I316_07711 [Kwoniella heveanensis BCC8398]|uniref:Uncharacterized protein n=1 Tax=Kwoniella heveanensis BCC8398 TaxID=1296120 RepID=A0A1B9GI57_9TREE|nr:hypothetical protein I316_07711 [Kwoniella heveanensis BCC8398]
MSITSATTIFDDTAPYISYQGSWSPQDTSDPFISRYKNSTFHGTTSDGDTATITFIGTDIQVFGAKRPNHGYLSGSIDEEAKIYMNGYARNPEEYQVVLFEAHHLANATHEVVMTNEPMYNTSVAGGNWFDIDFVAINGTPIAKSGSGSGSGSSTSSSGTITQSLSAPLQTDRPDQYPLPLYTVAGIPEQGALQLAVSVTPSLP